MGEHHPPMTVQEAARLIRMFDIEDFEDHAFMLLARRIQAENSQVPTVNLGREDEPVDPDFMALRRWCADTLVKLIGRGLMPRYLGHGWSITIGAWLSSYTKGRAFGNAPPPRDLEGFMSLLGVWVQQHYYTLTADDLMKIDPKTFMKFLLRLPATVPAPELGQA